MPEVQARIAEVIVTEGNSYPAPIPNLSRRIPVVFPLLVLVITVILGACSNGSPTGRSDSSMPIDSVSASGSERGGGQTPSGQLPSGSSSPDFPSASRTYPWHTNIVATTFWVGEVFDPNAPDGSQVYSTYDPQWEAHYGGCDGVVSDGTCQTEPRSANNGYFPTAMTPLENPFYLDLPFDDLNNADGFRIRGQVIPWASDPGYSDHVDDPSYSLMKNRWVEIVGPNHKACYGQIEDAGPGVYDDWRYVFGSHDERPANKRFNGAGMDVSPALNACLGFSELNGENDKVSWRFVESSQVLPGPWLELVTLSR